MDRILLIFIFLNDEIQALHMRNIKFKRAKQGSLEQKNVSFLNTNVNEILN